jgi:hypothetical protein
VSALGACAAFIGGAAAYRRLVGPTRRAAPTVALALLGVAASAWVIEATVRVAYTAGAARSSSTGGGIADLVGVGSDPLTVIALLASGLGFVLLAGAVRRAGHLSPRVGGLVAGAAVVGVIGAHPATAYLLGAGSLGVGLLTAAPGVSTVDNPKESVMKRVYQILAYAVAAEVAVQAMLMVFAIAGLGIWVDSGGVFDKAVMESEGSPFPEVVGFMLHGMNGLMVIPLVALALFVCSFFAKVPRGVRWAGVVLLLVVVQVLLGMFGHVVSGLGALHGLNALLLFTAALYTARRVRSAAAAEANRSGERVATSA